MTIYDVAREAGVSHQTVSRVINDRPGVAAATRQRVLSAAQQLRFVPNRAAQGLRSKVRDAIGCIVVVEAGRDLLLSPSTVQSLLAADATMLLRLVERGEETQREDAIDSLRAQDVGRILFIDAGAVDEVQLNRSDITDPTDRPR